MQRFYYLMVAIVGTFSAFLVALYLLGQHFFIMLDSSSADKFNGLYPISLGIISILLTGLFLDKLESTKKNPIPFFKGAILFPATIYITGMLVGTMANYLINARSSLEFNDYFVKVIFALSMFGIPASLIVGIIVYAVHRGYFQDRTPSLH